MHPCVLTEWIVVVSKSDAGFTLIEILVVILIILIVSAVALPTLMYALSHRQVSEAAHSSGSIRGRPRFRYPQQCPSGIRLLPDPAFPIQRLSDGTIDPSQILAANRIIPIEPAPAYSEGLVSLARPRSWGNLYSLIRAMAAVIIPTSRQPTTHSCQAPACS